MDKGRDEAFDFVRRGLRNSLGSANCWHVYGVLWRVERNYEQAVICFRNALKHDPESMQILRDLSMAQLMVRDFKGLQDSRKRLLISKPAQRNHWLGFAMAHHLAGNCNMALQIIDVYEKTIEQQKESPFELSELLTYKNMILEESGNAKAALDHLKSSQKILDKLFLMETEARLLAKLERNEEATGSYMSLLKRNSENHNYIKGLLAVKGLPWPVGTQALPDATIKATLDVLESIQQLVPSAVVPQRLALDVARGQDFKGRADSYIRKRIVKGIPSLFADLRGLYQDQEKAKILGDLCEGYVLSLKQDGKFPGEISSESEVPSALLWALALLAQHYDQLQAFERAIELFDEALTHTPTALELYLFKARAYKHAGNPALAADMAEEARKLDLADRYLNNNAAKYLLRAGRIEQAEHTMTLFTKHGDTSLYEMQCMWYELESGAAYVRAGSYGKALKKYHAVDKHFEDIFDDQYDFFAYCLRKTTLRSCVEMIRVESNMHGHKFFVRAAKRAIECYLHLYQNPDGELRAIRALPAAEQRKAFKKLIAKRSAAAGPAKPAKSGGKPDLDPEGVLLANVLDPLSRAEKFLDRLQRSASKDQETHLLAGRIYLCRNKPLLALRALKRAAALGSGREARVVELVKALTDSVSKLSPSTSTVVVDILRNDLAAFPV
eukprot:TRINITY_DN15029_c0_g1_i1.p1 TRINITY_DN15029_c0_g1~~TRINITY_DN15029_c0_g1_i1.p1  ORF type:complete len:739 (+),score=130.85 TRINITY_DN15029_c0_g1_i1:209-2218(+)